MSITERGHCVQCGRAIGLAGNHKYCRTCATRTCEQCGQQFVATTKALRRAHQFCTPECYRLWRWGRQCMVCGKTITVGRLCSEVCAQVHRRQRDIARGPVKRERERAKGWTDKIAFMRSLGGRCTVCGNDDLRVLEFNHIDPSKKDSRVRHHTGGPFAKRLRILESERDNLELLCANCHRIRTHEEIWRTNGMID